MVQENCIETPQKPIQTLGEDWQSNFMNAILQQRQLSTSLFTPWVVCHNTENQFLDLAFTDFLSKIYSSAANIYILKFGK